MAFVKTIRQIRLLVLEENEAYLLDRDECGARLVKPEPSLVKSITSFNQQCKLDDIMGGEVPDSIKLCLNSSLEKPFDVCLRLCSKSIILDRSQTGKEIIKVLFNKIRGVWFLSGHPRRPSVTDLFEPISQTSPRLILLTDSITTVTGVQVGGRYRIVQPYTTCRGSFLVELRSKLLRTVPKPEPPWYHSELEQLIQQQKLLNSSDPLFFLLLSAKVIYRFLSSFKKKHQSRVPTNGLSALSPVPNSSSPVSKSSSPVPKPSSSVPTLISTPAPLSFENVIKIIQSIVPSPDSFPFARLDHRETHLLSIQVERQFPLHTCRGILAITDAAIYFRPFPNLENTPFLRLPWTAFRAAILRIVDLRPTVISFLHAPPRAGARNFVETPRNGLTSTTAEIGEFNIVCRSQRELNQMIQVIESVKPDCLIAGRSPKVLKHVTELWRTRRLDTFHYLGFLNSLGGRSVEDLSQYPVMPWTYVDFMSQTIDLDDPTRYRDLTRPVGAINAKCLELLRERLDEMTLLASQRGETDQSSTHSSQFEVERFLYGSHYSTAAYVVYWLIRLAPECQLCLQSGKFDAWPRLLHSIGQTWQGIWDGRATSFMELIPELYDHSNPDFLENRLGLNICASSQEMAVGPNSGLLSDVELPPWAEGNGAAFLKVLREGLESDIVSENINHWIDLIFGYQQSGEAAEAAFNLFHPVTYLTSQMAAEDEERKLVKVDRTNEESLLTQVREFGQAPRQLFSQPHPKRLSREEVYALRGDQEKAPDPTDLRSILAFPRSCSPWYMYLESLTSEEQPGCSSNLEDAESPAEGRKTIQSQPIRTSNRFGGEEVESTGDPLLNGWESIGRDSLERITEKRQDDSVGNGTFRNETGKNEKNGIEQINLARFRTSQVIEATLSPPYPNKLFRHLSPCRATSIAYNDSENSIIFGTTHGTFCKVNLGSSDNPTASASCSVMSVTALWSMPNGIIVAGAEDGSISMLMEVERLLKYDDDLTPTTTFQMTSMPERSPHVDSVTTVTSNSRDKMCTDQVVAFWNISPPGLQLGGISDIQDVSAGSMTDTIAILGGRHGEVTFWDTRVSENSPVWEGLITLDTSMRPIITDCNTTGLLTSGCFSLMALGQTELPLELSSLNHVPSWMSRHGGWDIEHRSVFNKDVYASFRNPFISPVRHFYSHRDDAEQWTALLFDIRMIGRPASALGCLAPAHLNPAIIGRHTWRSSSTEGSSQTVTSAATDGQRWAVAIGVMSTRQHPSNDADGSKESIDLPSSSSMYCTFCSIADLSQGLRATESCRWPLMLGTNELPITSELDHSNDVDLTMPTLLAPAQQWQLTGDARLCVANVLGQIEQLR